MRKITTKEDGVYSLGNSKMLVVLEGILKIYETEEKIIVQKMEKIQDKDMKKFF